VRTRPDRRFAVGIVMMSVITVADISTSGLDGNTAISGCPSMSRLLVDTLLSLFEYVVVENLCFSSR